MKTREIIIYGILSAVLLAAQVSLGFSPPTEIVIFDPVHFAPRKRPFIIC